MLKTSIAALAVGLAVLPAAAHADTPAGIDIAVSYNDLADPAARAELEARIEEAATDICRDRLRGDLLRPYTLRSCVDAVTEAALADAEALHGIDAPVSQTLAARD